MGQPLACRVSHPPPILHASQRLLPRLLRFFSVFATVSLEVVFPGPSSLLSPSFITFSQGHAQVLFTGLNSFASSVSYGSTHPGVEGHFGRSVGVLGAFSPVRLSLAAVSFLRQQDTQYTCVRLVSVSLHSSSTYSFTLTDCTKKHTVVHPVHTFHFPFETSLPGRSEENFTGSMCIFQAPPAQGRLHEFVRKRVRKTGLRKLRKFPINRRGVRGAGSPPGEGGAMRIL